MSFLTAHLVESTGFCLLLSLLACSLRKGPRARYSLWLAGISKFAIPSVLLANAGARIAFAWPAAEWLSNLADRISAALSLFWRVIPRQIEENGHLSREFLLVWALGSAAMAGIWLVRLRKLPPTSGQPSVQELQDFERAKRILGINRRIELRCSEEAVEPAIRGIWQPIVTVPNGLSLCLSRSEFESVLLHELAHARRRDNLAAVFVHLLVCLFWFHPLLWWVKRRLLVERERACDELVLASGMPPKAYAAGILKVCRFHLLETAGVSAMTGTDLRRRLELILAYRISSGMEYIPRVLLLAAPCLMMIFPIAGGYCEQCVSSRSPQAVVSPASQNPAVIKEHK